MPCPERQIDESISSEVLAKIFGRELLVEHLGCWPTFHDFEVISIVLERAPWPNTARHDLRATFFAFDLNKKPTDSERKQALVEILFGEILKLHIEGFNHQNPITGLSIVISNKQANNCKFQVQWGGTCLDHEVSFSCNRISVLRVIDLNPFRKPLVE
jgi:hypothetical protein